MEKFEFLVTEATRKTVVVYAEDYREASEQMDAMLENGEIDMEKDINDHNIRFCLSCVYPDYERNAS